MIALEETTVLMVEVVAASFEEVLVAVAAVLLEAPAANGMPW